MSSYWRAGVPAFRLARRLYRDLYGPLTTNRYLDKVFRSPPWAGEAHSKKLALGFNESFKKHWKEFAKDMNESFGVNVQVDHEAADIDKSTGAAEQIHPSETASESANDFKVTLDVMGFTPKELSVKIIGNTLRVEAKHESTKDGSHFLKSYTREFILPGDVDLDALKSTLNPDGMLILRAPRSGVQQERAIPVDITEEEGPPQNVHDTEPPADRDNHKDS